MPPRISKIFWNRLNPERFSSHPTATAPSMIGIARPKANDDHLSPSTVVRYGDNWLASSCTVMRVRMASAAVWISSRA